MIVNTWHEICIRCKWYNFELWIIRIWHVKSKMLNEEYTIWIGNKSDNVTACFVKFRWLFLYSLHIDKHSYQNLIISFLGKATFVMWSRVEGKFVAKSCWLPHLKCYESHHSHFIPSSCSCIIVISVWEARSSKAF